MLNRSASLAMSTSVLKALPGKFDIKRHSPIYPACKEIKDHPLSFMQCATNGMNAKFMYIRTFYPHGTARWLRRMLRDYQG